MVIDTQVQVHTNPINACQARMASLAPRPDWQYQATQLHLSSSLPWSLQVQSIPSPPCFCWRTLPIKSHLSKKPPPPSACLHSPLSFSVYSLIDFLKPTLAIVLFFRPLNAIDCFPHSQSSTSVEFKKWEWEKQKHGRKKEKGGVVQQQERLHAGAN